MGPIVYGFEGRGSLNRSRFLVYSPLSRLLNVPPYSPTSIDTHYASFMVLPPGTFFFSEFLGSRYTFIYLSLANDVQKSGHYFMV